LPLIGIAGIDPRLSYSFIVDLPASAGWTEEDRATITAIEWPEARVVNGQVLYKPVRVERIVRAGAADLRWHRWYERCLNEPERGAVGLYVIDPEGAVVETVTLTAAYPVGVGGAPMSSLGDTVWREHMWLAYSGIRRDEGGAVPRLSSVLLSTP
jgi:hypothetical protein